MGLSGEERIQRVLNSLVTMRKELDPEDINKWEDRSNHRVAEYISVLSDSLDQLTGMLIQQTDTNGFYWFMGESDDSFRGLTMDYFRAQTDSLSRAYIDASMESKEDEDLSLAQFARELGFGMHSGMLDLAVWWDLWCFIPSLLYGMNRYQDDLFKPAFRKEVNRLISLLQQFRRLLVAGRYQQEQVMLLKYKLYVDDKYTDERPWRVRCEALRDMSQTALEEELSKRERDKWDSRRKSGEKEDDKRDKKIDPVHGNVSVTIDGLVNDVRTLLHKKGSYRYFSEVEVIRALDLYEGNVDWAADQLFAFGEKRHAHARRYGRDNVKTCKRCQLVVLDQRNKSGFCAECLTAERKQQKRKRTRAKKTIS